MSRSSLANTVQSLLEWEDLFFPVSGLKVDATHVLTVRREVVPIVFVPGIMGSILLRVNDKGKEAAGTATLRFTELCEARREAEQELTPSSKPGGR
jgi:hypothetical protein